MEIVIFLFAVCAIVHWLDVFLKARRVVQWQNPTNIQFPSISLVICAHNEAKNLKDLIPLLKCQDYLHLEVILVLDRCTDESVQLTLNESHWMKVLSIKNISEAIHPKKYGITKAIDQSKGEWILLTDADCRPGPNWVSEMAKAMTSDKDVVIGISPYLRDTGLLNALIQYETFMTALQFVSAAIVGKAYMGLGRNLAYRKSAFLHSGGFAETASRTGGDDDLLVQRLSTPTNVGVMLSEQSKVDSIPKAKWSSYVRQKIRHFSVSPAYTKSSKMAESRRWIVHMMFWLLFPLSLFVNWQLTLLIFVGSFLMKAISINIVSDGLEKRFNHLWLPFVDLTYVVVLPLLSLRSLLVKRITWN